MARLKVKWLFAKILCISSFLVMYQFHLGWQCFASIQCVNVEISGKKMLIDPDTASAVSLLRELDDKFASNERTFIATPFWPGAYALLERKSPMWEIYALSPRGENFEMMEIDRIKKSNPSFAIIFDLALDGREELRFKNTHPLTNNFITNNFTPVETYKIPSLKIYKAYDSPL